MRIGTIVLTLVTLCSSASISFAQAAVDEEAKTHFEQGVALFKEGKHEQATIAFGRAYELKPSFRILWNIGQVENELGHYAAALMAYTRYLADGGDEVPEDRVKQAKAEIKRLNALVGMIVIQGGEEGATVLVDKEEKGKTPLESTIFVDLGKHEVAVEKGGKKLLDRVITVAGGEKVVLEIGVEEAKEEAAPVEEEQPVDEPKKRVWTWVAFGLGGAAAIGAGVTGGLAVGEEKSLSKSCEGKVCPEDEQSSLDKARTLATTTNVLIAVASVGVAAGVLLFFLEPKMGAEKEESVAVLPAAGPDGAGLMISGRF